jgi:hypothetical protein
MAGGDELTERKEDLRSLFGDRAGHSGEDREGCEPHHVIGNLEHHLHQRFDAANDGAVLRGPARQPLATLPLVVDPSTGQILLST